MSMVMIAASPFAPPLGLLGATASGKTSLSLKIARHINAEIISADSMQVYRGLDRGTAKPTIAERAMVPHHLIDILNPDEPYSVFDFTNRVRQLLPQIKSRGRRALIVGGTGLYWQALLGGLSFAKAPPNAELRAHLAQFSGPELFARLAQVDPEGARQIHPNNRRRVLRALEVYLVTGQPATDQVNAKNQEGDYQLIGLQAPRPELYVRINQRVDQMLQDGLLAEVRGLLRSGYAPSLPAFQALGYKETIAWLSTAPLERNPAALAATIALRTRHFAKRQLTWFRRFSTIKWLDITENNEFEYQ